MIVEKTSQLFGDLPDRALRPVGGLRPVMVDSLDAVAPLIGFDRVESGNLGQQIGQLCLALFESKKS
ncbi:hypothetical protein EB75_09885 [Mycobacterium sp. ST-F2]|nr:hypothetical protein EB75_09885 [Mycobacterium sp. ST-F2]